MRSPKMTELMSGDYAVTGKLLSDVGLDVGMAYGRAVRISLTDDLLQVRRQAIRGVWTLDPSSVAASRISSDSLQEGRIGIAIRREANGPLVRTNGSPRSRPNLSVNWTYFEATLREQALELPALGAAQHPFLSWPIMGEGRGSPEPIRQVRDGQGVRHGCVVPEDSPEIRQ